jgi:DNA mismatch repair protein MutL
MPIQVLSNEVASQIAAGEVVERPVSVIKELVENSLDAGAKQISIRVESAGQRLVEVADDGSGIRSEEIELAVARHATSKLRVAEELFHIQTLGFRGEALASIASVSHFSLVSRVLEETTGARLRVSGGKTEFIEAVGAPAGTVITVENLFYNVPARLKFLKKDLTERRLIDGFVMRYAMAYPAVRFKLTQDKNLVLQTTGSGDRQEVLAKLYGIDTARQMLQVNLEEEDNRVTGFTSPLSVTRSNRREITFFVNGRWIQDTSLSAALIQGYQTLLMVGRYPMAVLFMEILPEDVDVNVHPAKAEVRFRNSERIFSLVQRSIRRTLLAYAPVQPIVAQTWRGLPEQKRIDPAWEMAAELKSNPALPESELQPVDKRDGATPTPLPGAQFPILRLLGQIGSTYLVAEGPDGLYLIDQHAAHERVLYERFSRHETTSIPSQELLEPTTLQLPIESAYLLSQYLDILIHLGFTIESFGPGTFRIRAIPAFLQNVDPISAVRVVVEEFEEDETPLQAELEERLAARICKRAAVKAGQTLSIQEQEALLRGLESCQSPRTCPHGRPTMVHLSVDLLERQFGRRGSR